MSTLANPGISPELLTSGKRASKPEAPEASSKDQKKRFDPKAILYGFFYLALAITSFIIFLLPKLPYQNLAQSALNFLSQKTPYIWQSESVNSSFLFGPKFEFKKLSLTSKPIGFGSQGEPKHIQLDTLSIRPGIMGVGFNVNAFQGEVSGHVGIGLESQEAPGFAPKGVAKKNEYTAVLNELDLKGEKISLEKVAAALQMQGLDIKGTIQQLAAELSVPKGRFSASNGSVNLVIKGLNLDPAGFNSGMALPILSLGDAKVAGTITNGRLTLRQTQIGSANSDVEVLVDGTVTLREPIEVSEMDLQLKIKFAPKITQALPYIDSFLSAGKRKDGYYGLKLAGTFAYPGMPTPFAGN